MEASNNPHAFSIILLAGLTGSGKTKLLRQLAGLGEQVIDLEKLSQHRGSAFGGLNQPAQPSPEEFNQELQAIFHSFRPERPVFIEQKGQSLGQLQLPKWFLRQLERATVIFLNVSLPLRIAQIMETYQQETNQQFLETLKRMTSRIPADVLDQAGSALARNDRYAFIHTMLTYYDTALGYASHSADWHYRITTETDDYSDVIEEVLRLSYGDIKRT